MKKSGNFQKVYDELNKDPKANYFQLRKSLPEIPVGSISSAMNTWKKKHQVVGPLPEIEMLPISIKQVDPQEVANNLLDNVVKFLQEKESLTSRLKAAEDEALLCNKNYTELEAEFNKLKDENRRILKVHNEQAQKKRMVSTEELLRLAEREPRGTL